MKLKSRLMIFTAATALSTGMAFAAINPERLAQSYRDAGYTYVEVKVGPTQTKLEAVKGSRKVEVIYDNVSEDVISQEFGNAGAGYVGRTGVEIETSARDFADDSDDDESDDSADDENDDDESGDDQNDDQNDDDENDDDESGDDKSGGGDKSDDKSNDDSSGGDDGDDGDED